MILFVRLFIIASIVGLTGFSFYKYRLMYKLKHNPKYVYYEKEKDTYIKKFSDSCFTSHYIMTKNLISKDVVAYNDLV